ncbi:MAG: hypothetical protein HUU21_32055 [Polyangiaceae bacterium]|nr:hypothetical protein [Polyangiaceae bacterium]
MPKRQLTEPGRLGLLDAPHLKRLAAEQPSLDGANVEVVPLHLEFTQNLLVLTRGRPRPLKRGEPRGIAHQKKTVTPHFDQANLGYRLKCDAAARDHLRLFGKGLLGKLVEITHEIGSIHDGVLKCEARERLRREVRLRPPRLMDC